MGWGYSPEIGIYDCFRLPDHCSVHSAEGTSIQEAMMNIEIIKPDTRVINLFSDSQAGLKTFNSYVDYYNNGVS